MKWFLLYLAVVIILATVVFDDLYKDDED